MERYSQFWISTANNSGKVSFESNCLVASGSSSSSWEEEAFAEDAAGRFGGLIWPPRSYRCNFCGREFKSAQALGGHMNIHRKEKAKINNNHDHDHDQDHKEHNKIRFNPQDYIRSSTEPKKENEGIILASGFGSSSSSIRVFGILGDKRTTEKDQKERNNMAGCKRRRIDEESQYISNIESSRSWAPIKILKGAIDDLDLELRLGDPPKVK